MKVGDLVRVQCDHAELECECFFCSGNSNGFGVILGPAEMNMWHVMFDIGEWELSDDECRAMNEIG